MSSLLSMTFRVRQDDPSLDDTEWAPTEGTSQDKKGTARWFRGRCLGLPASTTPVIRPSCRRVLSRHPAACRRRWGTPLWSGYKGGLDTFCDHLARRRTQTSRRPVASTAGRHRASGPLSRGKGRFMLSTEKVSFCVVLAIAGCGSSPDVASGGGAFGGSGPISEG